MSTNKTFTFEAENGIIFTARRVDKGDKYGIKGCLTHEKNDPLIEFYDSRFTTSITLPIGQFVSRYYLSTLMQTYPYNTGLALDSSVCDWRIDAKSINDVLEALKDEKTEARQVPNLSEI